MSVRFFKIFFGVVLTHLIVLSVVWVGFSAPLPRPPARFIYQGELPFEDTGGSTEEVWQNSNPSDQFALDHFNGSDVEQWIRLRQAIKPIIHL